MSQSLTTASDPRRREPAAVGTEGQGRDRRRVSPELAALAAGFRVPDPHHLVGAARDERVTIRAEGQAEDLDVGTSNGGVQSAGLDVPELDRPIAGRGNSPAIRAEHDPLHLAAVMGILDRRSSRPSAASQIRTTRDVEPVAIVRPSGLNATLRVPPELTLNWRSSSAVRVFQIPRVASGPGPASRSPSGLKARPDTPACIGFTIDGCRGSSVSRTCPVAGSQSLTRPPHCTEATVRPSGLKATWLTSRS